MFDKSLIMLLALNLLISCSAGSGVGSDDRFLKLRLSMVEDQIVTRGVRDPLVLEAMRKVERHLFVPDEEVESAYADHPLPIGYNQTISQPYIVALMTELVGPTAKAKVLEIGTGSGYQAAVLAEIVNHVYTIEIVDQLHERAEKLLKKLGYKNVHCKAGDGYYGWEEHAPFDAIIITAAPRITPEPLLKQLKVGGRLVVPVGEVWQELIVITKTSNGFNKESIIPVRFVPMTGEAEKN